MPITVASSPTSGNIIHETTAANFSCAGATANTSTGYDNTKYPASPQIVYYFTLDKSGSDSLRSERFAVDSTGIHQWPSVIVPTAGTWTLNLRKNSDDSSVANASIVVT